MVSEREHAPTSRGGTNLRGRVVDFGLKLSLNIMF